MLYPSMNDLLKRVGNRYLLVNIAAKRARDVADDAEEREIPLADKAVKIALEDILSGKVAPVYPSKKEEM